MCAHIISPKKKWQLICGNGIVEIEGKKNLWQKTKKNLWDRFRRDINRWFYWEWSINIFQAENKNQMKRWYDWLIDSSLTIQGRNMTYTQNRSKKLLKNRNMCTTFFKKKFLSLSLSLSSNFLFWQYYCQKSNNLFFFFLLFRQCHCHKPITIIFFPPTSAMPLPQIHSHKFFFSFSI